MITKTVHRDDRMQKSTFLSHRSSLLTLVIAVFSLFSLFLSACQTQPKQSKAITPPANTETLPVSPPKVTQIDEQGLKDLLKPRGKPLLINFWATWCGPCREEFPDLVRIGKDHKNKIDLVTVSLDELSEINSAVPDFLAQMGFGSPAYLLKASDPGSAIELVSKDWQGALPFTILFNADGETIYSKQGKFDTDALVDEIEDMP